MKENNLCPNLSLQVGNVITLCTFQIINGSTRHIYYRNITSIKKLDKRFFIYGEDRNDNDLLECSPDVLLPVQVPLEQTRTHN